MAKKKDLFEQTLTQAEILNYAICFLGDRCRKYYDDIVNANNEEIENICRNIAQPWFWKLKKLMELYELETGKEYSNEYDFINE